ncbi:MAG: hypothetical protein QOE45_691 [Frankiaceae bacterium]|jgi:hypothetical protein|nr:hypothetical protein [Frankiaceae bacterium]
MRGLARAVVFSVVTTLVSPLAVAPARAEAPDDLVYVGTFEAPASMLAAVDAVLQSAAGVTRPCITDPNGITQATNWVGTIGVDVFRSITELYVMYKWHGDGVSYARKSCASSVRVEVRIIDNAAKGKPMTIAGPVATATNTAGSGTFWEARAMTWDEVVEFNGTYIRGMSSIQLQVRGSFVTGKKRYPIPCKQTVTQVLPTPDQPVYMGTTPPGPCV